MKKICLLLSCFLSLSLFAQKIISGVVLDDKGEGIANASVFLSNTSTGTVSNSKGEFNLHIPEGKYDLVVSSIGFETYTIAIASKEEKSFYSIRLKAKIKELENIIVEPFEKDGWDKWGRFFTENFIGLSEFADKCSIINYKTIKFRNSKRTNELTAYATEPLIIENKSLGYIIHYQLESFTYNFNDHYLSYEGYPLFEPMKGGSAKQKKWKENRAQVYYGSMLHFMRSLYRNKLEEEGFEIRRLKKIINSEKDRVQKAYKAAARKEIRNGIISISHDLPTDTLNYYNKVMRQPGQIGLLNKNALPADSIAFAVDSVTAGLFFTDYLQVLYKKKEAAFEYYYGYSERGKAMLSELVLVHQKPVEIQANGNYYQPLDLMSAGYWSWSEKTGSLLPLDYKPEIK